MSKVFWKDYFSFSKKERTAIIILLIIIVVFIILPFFFTRDFEKPFIDGQLQKQLMILQNSKARDSSFEEQIVLTDTIIKDSKQQTQFFYFDPNTLDESRWKKLGLSDKTIHVIINYRNKGGHFNQPEDIRKIYGLKREDADALIPYIKIESKKTQEQVVAKNKAVEKPQTQSSNNFKKIDINTATTEDFKTLTGLGDVLSNRIVKFRNAVHGFKSIEDIKKTYGLPDSTYNNILPYLTISDSSAQKN